MKRVLAFSILAGAVLSLSASAQEAPWGAVAPAMLPSGSTAVYGFVGAPELGTGFRQGLGPLEFQAEAAFNYLDLSFAGVARARFQVVDTPRWQLAPYAGLGFAWDSGSTYYDEDNAQYTAVRIDAGAVATVPVRETLALIATGELAWDLFTTPVGGHRLQPLVGGGAELALGDSVSAFALAEIGLDLRKFPAASWDTEADYSVRIGFAVRMF